tara:strand:- start:2306 stop:2758 length:453 start_codon:yes stop_codon:yes gene_type:complete
MELKKLVVDSKSAWIEFPGLDGFEVEVVNLSRKELQIIRKKCTTSKFSRKTRQIEESLDEEKFVEAFAEKSVKGWKGLTLGHLETLLLIDTKGQDLAKDVPYTTDNAEVLVTESNEFDTWLNEVVFDLDNFRSGTEGKVHSKTGAASQKS